MTNIPRLQKVLIRAYNCNLCKQLLGRKKVLPKINNNRWMIIGESPKQAEEISKQLFAGEPGVFLDEALTAVGWTRDDFYITSVLKCRPYKNSMIEATASTWIDNCVPNYLLEEIKAVNPTFIICFGMHAANVFIETGDILKTSGTITQVPFDGKYLLVGILAHPKFIIKQPVDVQQNYKARFIELLSGFKNYIDEKRL